MNKTVVKDRVAEPALFAEMKDVTPAKKGDGKKADKKPDLR